MVVVVQCTCMDCNGEEQGYDATTTQRQEEQGYGTLTLIERDLDGDVFSNRLPRDGEKEDCVDGLWPGDGSG